MKFAIREDTETYIPYQRGVKSLYNPRMCDLVIETAIAGGFHAAMCLSCGITAKTFDNYRKEHIEFNDAVEYADLITLSQQEQKLQDMADGKIKGDYRATAMLLNNKYRHIYDKTAGSNTEITINTINLTSDQMNAQIAQKLEKLKSMGIEVGTVMPTLGTPILIEHDNSVAVEE
jgi:hypothetical protein